LHPGYRAPVSVGKQHPLPKIGRSGQSAYLSNNPLAFHRKRLDLLLRWRLMYRLIQKPQNVCVPTIAMQDLGVHGICHKHVWPNPNCYLIVALPVKAQSVGFSPPEFHSVYLHGRGARRESPVPLKIEPRE
jgi:hypothetical protein